MLGFSTPRSQSRQCAAQIRARAAFRNGIHSTLGRNRKAIMPITVLLAEDKEVVRSSIRLLLESDPDIHTVGEAFNFKSVAGSYNGVGYGGGLGSVL